MQILKTVCMGISSCHYEGESAPSCLLCLWSADV